MKSKNIEKHNNIEKNSSTNLEKQSKIKKFGYGRFNLDRDAPLYIKSDYKKGLTSEEVEKRISKYQINTDSRPESNLYKSFKIIVKVICKNTFTFFNVLYMIVLALLIIAKLIKTEDVPTSSFVFLTVVIVNLVTEIIQETKSKLAINKLKLLTNPRVTVIRNGEKTVVKAQNVVLDDVVMLTPGIQIVADGTVLEGEIEVNESQLTGESVPIKKNVGDMVYSGSFVVSGTTYVKVEHVGKYNEINKLTSQAKKYIAPKSQIMSSLKTLLLLLSFVIVITSVIMFTRSFLKASGLSFTQLFNFNNLKGTGEAYVTAIMPTTAAIIGMIPAGLYMLTSIALSVGVVRLAKNNTLVQDIYCIEMLARVDVLCLDKTGTITNGKMTVINAIEISKPDTHSITEIIGSMNAALQETNATSQALTEYFGNRVVMAPKEIINFSSDRKYSAVSFGDGENYVIGAPEFVLKDDFEKYSSAVGDYASQGLRVICLAQSNLPFKKGAIQKTPKLLAFILIEDQIREEAPDTIRYFRESGVEVKVISGDNPVTVSEVARRVGIASSDKCVSLDGMTDDEVIAAANNFTVFGRVKPEQKKLLVKALQEAGKTVAMTGDGVNDIPALKQADCSIAMASGNDAVKGVAQLVLVDSNFASMPKVVSEGRRVINNIQQTSMLYLVKTLFMAVLAILTAAGFFGIFGPLVNGARDNTFPFAGSGQLLILEMFAIGIPSFILSVQPNNAPIKGKFLRNALKSATPGAVGIAGVIVLTYMFAITYGFTIEETKTIVALTATITLLIVMTRACIPYNKLKIVLVLVMWTLSLMIIVLSVTNARFENIKIFNINGFSFQDFFGFYALTWKVTRIGPNGVVMQSNNATALWLSTSMIVVSFALMLGVELLFKNIELKREINNNRLREKERLAKESEARKRISTIRIKY